MRENSEFSGFDHLPSGIYDVFGEATYRHFETILSPDLEFKTIIEAVKDHIISEHSWVFSRPVSVYQRAGSAKLRALVAWSEHGKVPSELVNFLRDQTDLSPQELKQLSCLWEEVLKADTPDPAPQRPNPVPLHAPATPTTDHLHNQFLWLTHESLSELSADDVNSTVDKLANVSKATLQEHAPRLINWLLNDLNTKEQHLPLIAEAIEQIMYLEADRSDELMFKILQLTEKGLELGQSWANRIGLTELLRSYWQTVASPHHLAWALDALDLLNERGVQTAEDRSQWVQSLIPFASAQHANLSIEERMALLDCAELYGLSDAFTGLVNNEETTPTYWNTLANKKVGIYSLNESSAERAKKHIMNLCPTVNIVIRHDKGNSDQLTSLVRNSDYFIMVWRHAKHAASEAIQKQWKGAPQNLLLPKGRGMSSIITTLGAALSNDSSA